MCAFILTPAVEDMILIVPTLTRVGFPWGFVVLLHSSFPDRSAKDGLDGGFSKNFEIWFAPRLVTTNILSMAMETTEKLVFCHSFTPVKQRSQCLPFSQGELQISQQQQQAQAFEIQPKIFSYGSVPAELLLLDFMLSKEHKVRSQLFASHIILHGRVKEKTNVCKVFPFSSYNEIIAAITSLCGITERHLHCPSSL